MWQNKSTEYVSYIETLNEKLLVILLSIALCVAKNPDSCKLSQIRDFFSGRIGFVYDLMS